MPSPLNGLMEPAASPMAIQVGPLFGWMEPAMGRRPPVASPSMASGSIPQCSGAVAAHSFMRYEVLMSRQPRKVESSPMPTLMVPSPHGKIQPYPGMASPLRSRTSRADSIQGSACMGLSKYPRMAMP